MAAAAWNPGGLPPLRKAWTAVAEAEEALAANQNAVAVLERMLIEIGPAEQQRQRQGRAPA
jgi:hypothetical protein